MIRKLKSHIIILILILAFVNTLQTTANSLKVPIKALSESNNNEINNKTKINNSKEIEKKAAETESTMDVLKFYNNTPSFVTLYHPDEKVIWLFEDVPFNSSKYHIEMTEYLNPMGIDVDLYVKFGSIPSTNDYDFFSSSINDIESIDIEAPNNHEYGDMYIMAYCVSGSGQIVMNAWYILDNNGCWRSADLIDTPIHNEVSISWSDTVSSTDTNDFYKIFLYSGQIIKIDVEVTSGWGTNYVDMYLYSENHILFSSDTAGNELDIEYNLTIYKNQFYYLVFRYAEVQNSTHSYSAIISDENSDLDNRFDGSAVITIDTGNYSGTMNNTDYNDYLSFYANSGENITITIVLDETLESPYYDAFIYTYYNKTISPKDALNSVIGTTLILNYCCSEYNSSEIDLGTRNLIYLRIWNAARNAKVVNDTASYNITFVRGEYLVNGSLLSTAPDYTTLGTNDTKSKYSGLSGYWDVNDFFKITTKMGYNIKISVRPYNTPMPFISGYLYDDTGALLTQDLNCNITISYIAPYSGDYYFRIYETAASNSNASYCGVSYYRWFIYTSVIDASNDDFNNAQQLGLSDSIFGDLNSFDTKDCFHINIPSGYQLKITYVFSLEFDLFVYNDLIERIPNNSTLPKTFIYHNKACETKSYFILLNNTLNHDLISYTLVVRINQVDSDGSMYTAVHIPITEETSQNGNDSLCDIDINDYYYFFASSNNGEIIISIEGVGGFVVQLIQNVANITTTLVSITIANGDPLEIIYLINQSLSLVNKFYLRFCNPNGAFSGSYSWSLIRIDYQTTNQLRNWIWITLSIVGILFTFILIITIQFLIKRKRVRKE